MCLVMELTFDDEEGGVPDLGGSPDAVVDDALELAGVGLGGVHDGQVQSVAVQHGLGTATRHVIAFSDPLDSVLFDGVGVRCAHQLGCLVRAHHDMTRHLRNAEWGAQGIITRSKLYALPSSIKDNPNNDFWNF